MAQSNVCFHVCSFVLPNDLAERVTLILSLCIQHGFRHSKQAIAENYPNSPLFETESSSFLL